MTSATMPISMFVYARKINKVYCMYGQFEYVRSAHYALYRNAAGKLLSRKTARKNMLKRNIVTPKKKKPSGWQKVFLATRYFGYQCWLPPYVSIAVRTSKTIKRITVLLLFRLLFHLLVTANKLWQICFRFAFRS